MSNARDDRPPGGPWHRVLLFAGAVGLLAAMATDALAVLGRHTGFALKGSIEIFQVCAVVAISAAILLATIADRHAHVDLITGLLSDRMQRVLDVAGRVATILAFSVLTVGSAWVAIELWPRHEITEALAIPLAGFRLFWVLCCLAGGAWSVRLLVRGVSK